MPSIIHNKFKARCSYPGDGGFFSFPPLFRSTEGKTTRMHRTITAASRGFATFKMRGF